MTTDLKDTAHLLLDAGAVPVLALDARQAARALSISPRTLASLTARGEVPSFRIGARRLYSTQALAEWVAAQGGRT